MRRIVEIVPVEATNKTQVVVLGAGFGGLMFCRHFRQARAQVTLVDRANHHLFQPLLYQVATAGLSAPEIAQPIRSIFARRPDITVLLDEVTDFDLANHRVRLRKNTLDYDYLVLATGSETGYFGHYLRRRKYRADPDSVVVNGLLPTRPVTSAQGPASESACCTVNPPRFQVREITCPQTAMFSCGRRA